MDIKIGDEIKKIDCQRWCTNIIKVEVQKYLQEFTNHAKDQL